LKVHVAKIRKYKVFKNLVNGVEMVTHSGSTLPNIHVGKDRVFINMVTISIV